MMSPSQPPILISNHDAVPPKQAVAQSNAGAAGRYDQRRMCGMATQGSLNLGLFVRYQVRAFDRETRCLEGCHDGRPGEIRAVASGARVADGEDHRLCRLWQAGGHCLIVRGVTRFRRGPASTDVPCEAGHCFDSCHGSVRRRYKAATHPRAGCKALCSSMSSAGRRADHSRGTSATGRCCVTEREFLGLRRTPRKR